MDPGSYTPQGRFDEKLHYAQTDNRLEHELTRDTPSGWKDVGGPPRPFRSEPAKLGAKRRKPGVFRLVVAGDRNYTNYDAVAEKLDALLSEMSPDETIEIVSGGAKGVDSLGERYATERGLSLVKFPADWGKLGKAAGPLRNKQMAEYADALFSIQVPTSRGTISMRNMAAAQYEGSGLSARAYKVPSSKYAGPLEEIKVPG